MKKHSLLCLLVLSSCSSPKTVRTISSSEAPAQIRCEEKVAYGESDVTKCHLEAGSINKLFHPYQQALIQMYSARLRQKTGPHSAEEINHLYDRASAVFSQVLKHSNKNKKMAEPQAKTLAFEEARFGHGSSDLAKKIKLIASWKAGKSIKIPSLDYAVTD